MHNKLKFTSVAGDFFPSEVRVPHKLDSFTVDLPVEYHTTTTTPTTLDGTGHGSTLVNGATVTGTASGGGLTGHLVFTNNTSATGTSYSDFPRFSDADGLNTIWDISYPISNVGTDNSNIDGYKVPVTFYTRDEFGNVVILIDTFTISEAKPEITMAPLGGPVQINDGGSCSNSYMDVLVSNNTIYGADNVYIAALSNAGATIVSIQDAPGETPDDPIVDADTNVYGASNIYAELGGMIAGGRRIVRISFNSTVCDDSIKLYSNFGCNYPVAREPDNFGNTLDSAQITYNAVPPSMMSGPVDGNKNIANLCDTQTLEIEVRNVKNPNLSNIMAGIKLPANVRYVPNTAEIAYPTNLWVAAPTTTVVGTDSININISSDIELAIACGLPGADETKFPNINFAQTNASNANVFKVRFDVDFVACPTSSSDEVFYDIKGYNYCGDSTITVGVFNLIYSGVATAPNVYSCQPANSTPLEICGDSGTATNVADSMYINNTSGPVTVAGDSIEITIASDTGRFDISNFTVAAPWTAPVVGVSAAGRTTLKYEIPSGVATGDSILMVMNYDITPKVDNACFAAAIPCSAIAHSMSFYSSVSVECVAKGLTCTSLGTVTKGAGYVPRELACCKQGLGNFVWLDDDKDGIQDPGEVGVAGVSVDLYANGPDGLPNTADDVLVGSTKTDAYGKYYFNDIPTGDYNVAFTPPSNYTFTNPVGAGDNMDNTNSEVDTAAANFGRTGTFSITPGEQDSTVDAGLVLPTPTTATVGDYVWFDTDMDGVQDGTESGVAGVLVTLLDASGNVVSTALTDANGKYLFKDVEPGTYSVKFKAPMGTTFTTTGSDGVTGTAGDATDDSDADTDGKTGSFTVAAGDNIRNVDAGIIPQTNQKTSLGDRVWFDTNQDGIQDDGEVGIEGVMVILRDSAGMALDTTFTDINGNYSFDNLDSGKYIVKFVAPAGFTASPASTAVDIYGDGADMSDSDADQTTGETGLIHLLPGRRNSTVDAGFYNSNTNSIGDKVWYDTNKDGDQDVGEAGVQGVTVKLLDASGNPVNNPATGKPYVVQTDAEGNYKFVGLPNGMYTVEFANLPDGYVLTGQDQGGNNTTDSDADPNTGRTAAVNLTGNTHITHLDAGIYAGDAGLTASLGDKVWYDLDNDGIQDPGETGVEGITVTLKDYGPDGVPGGGDAGPDQTTRTHANGAYIFTGLDASNYVVQFSDLPAGYNPSPANAGGDDNADSDGGPLALGVSSSPVIRLSAGEENLSVDLGIYKAGVNSIGNKVWLDANQDGIQDASEIPVPGVQVTLLDGDGNIFDIDPSTPGVQPYTTTTDKEGNYLFTDLPDGTYSVKFAQLPNGYVFSPKNTGAIGTDSDADPATGKTGNVTVTGGQTNLTLDAGIYSSTKAALGNKVWSDDDGDGVQDPGEDGIAGVLVTLYDGGGNAIATTITDANGNYLFPNLDPGTYTVGFTNLPDGTTFTGQDEGGNDGTDSDVDPATGRTAPVTLAAGDVNLTVDAGVKPPATATVGNYVWFDKNRDGIQDADEPGVPGVIVTLRDGNGNVIGTTVTDGDGKYLFTNVPAGTGYTVTFDANLPYLGPSISSPHFTIQDASNTGGNKSIVPNTGAYNGLTATTPPFNVTAGSHTRLLDAGISSAFPLPVEMIELDILWVGDYSKVIWKTATEINNSHFEVERSLDGVNFVKVGEVNSKAMNGNSNSILSYDFMEDLASYSNHIFYYRVIQVDYDGASETSRILVLVRKELVNTSGITIQPNPAKTEFNVHVTALGLGSYTMDLIDVNGSVLNTYSSDKSEDEISFEKKTINVRNLPAGVYFVRIKMNDKITTSKIVILK